MKDQDQQSLNQQADEWKAGGAHRVVICQGDHERTFRAHVWSSETEILAVVDIDCRNPIQPMKYADLPGLSQSRTVVVTR